jgi:Dyp-type peroxidase family
MASTRDIRYVGEQPAETEAATPAPEPPRERAAVSRRGLIGATGAGLAGLAAGAAGGFVLGSEETTPSPHMRGTPTYPFYGEHQAGILTPVQDRLHFAALDVITDSRAELVPLLKDWTAAAARMTQGLGAGNSGRRRARTRHRRTTRHWTALAGRRLLSGGASHQHERRNLGPAAAE